MNTGLLLQVWSGKEVQSFQWKSLFFHAQRNWQHHQDHFNCVFFFLIRKVLSIMSTPLQAKQLIRSATSMFFVSWEMQCEEESQLWATSHWQLHHNIVLSHASHGLLQRFFSETSNHPGYLHPLQPRFGTLGLPAFLQIKITFEREEISDHQWDSEKYDRATDGDSSKGFCSVLNSGRDAGRTVWDLNVPNVKGTEVSLS